MNFGIVDWFGGNSLNYGFITPLNSTGDIYVHRSNILEPSKNLLKNEVVAFDLKKTPKGLAAVNVKRADAKILVEAVNFADADEYKNICAELRLHNLKFFQEFKVAIPQDLLKQYSWLRAELPTSEHLNLCVKMYSENPAPELADELSNLLRTCDLKNLPPQIFSQLPKHLFRQNSWLRAKLPADEHLNLCVEMYSENPAPELADEIFNSLRTYDFKSVTPQLEAWLSQLPKDVVLNAERWAKLSPEVKLKIFALHLNDFEENELVTKIEELTKLNLFPELVKIISANDNWAQIFSVCAEKSVTKIRWAEVLLEDVAKLPQIEISEDMLIILMYAAAKSDKISDALIKILVDKTNAHRDFYRAKIVDAYLRAGYANIQGNFLERDRFLGLANNFIADWFNLLADNSDNPAILPTVSLAEAFVFPPCTNRSAEKLFSDGKRIPSYFCEAVDWSRRKKTKTVEVFNETTGETETQTITYNAPCNYCPRLGRTDDHESCFRIEPQLDLSAEKWSLVELVDKLDLKIFTYGNYAERNNKEFFTRIGGEFNRIYELREHLKCRTCGEYMRSVKPTRWRRVKNLFQESMFEHFAAFASTTFQCQNPACSNEIVYLSYCWHCKGIIDSRDCHTRIRGYYSCEQCGAGYKDSVSPEWTCDECGFNDYWLKTSDDGAKLVCSNCGNEEPVSFYALFPATLCPVCLKCENCGGQDFDILELEEPRAKLCCKKCRKEIFASVTIEKDSDSTKKFKCSKCEHKLQVENNLERQVKRNSLKRIQWAKAK